MNESSEADGLKPFSSGLQPLGQLGAGQSAAGSLGSLTQAARKKHLRVATGIFIAVGLLTIVVNIFGYVSVESMIHKEIKDLEAKGMQFDPVKLEELRTSAIQTGKLLSIGMIGVGLLYLVFAAIVDRFPVAVTISGLVVYVGVAAAFALLNPAALLQGIILKVVVVAALVKSVQAAIAYERENKEALAETA